MDENEFLQGLKTDDEKFSEHAQSAEHFIRLKKQTGYQQPEMPELEKTAGPNSSFGSTMLKGTALGAGIGGVLGAVNGPAKDGKQRAKNIARSALGGGALGALSAPLKAVFNSQKGLTNAIKERTDVIAKGTSAMHGLRDEMTAARLGIKVKKPRVHDMKELSPGHFGLAEKRASLAEKLKSIGPLAAGLMGAGAAAGGVGTYLASRPHDNLDGKSKAESELEAAVAANQSRPEGGLLHKMKNRTTELEHGYAKAFRDHPVKASLLGAGAGAAGGLGLARLLDALRGAKR